MGYRDVTNLTETLHLGNGSGRVCIGPSGVFSLEESATKTGIIPVSLIGAKLGSPAGKVSINYDEGYAVFAPSGDIENTADRLMVTVAYPHNGVIGGFFSPIIKFIQTTANNTEFSIKNRIQPDNGGDPSVAWASGSTDIATSGLYEFTGDPIVQQVRLGMMSTAGFGDYPTIQGMITRSDPLSGDINALCIGVEYTIDKIGR